MMDAKVVWKRKLAFDGTANSGFTLPLDTRVDKGGEGSGFSPMELLLVGLAGCTGMDVIDILHKKQQDVTSFEVKVHADRATEHPKVFTHIIIEFIVTGHNLEPQAVDRSVELSTTKYCSASAMLEKTAQIEHKITILEAA
jgi:putative redox protein